LINPANGSDIATPESVVLGNIVPDWMGSIRNSFFYKNVNLSVLIDARRGSDLFSITHWFGHYAGMVQETVGLNDKGNPKRDPVENGGGVLIPGVYGEIDASGNPVFLDAAGNPSSTPVENTTYRAAQSWGHGFYGEPGRSVFDASFVKLREVIIGYTFNQQFIRNLGIQSINLSLVGRNLAIFKKNIPHIDPELGFSAGRIQGMESTQLPSLRSMGFNLQLNF
jgi:hypothetical protein